VVGWFDDDAVKQSPGGVVWFGLTMMQSSSRRVVDGLAMVQLSSRRVVWSGVAKEAVAATI
jgi:hypothetical protein